jgi:hypothetical protein
VIGEADDVVRALLQDALGKPTRLSFDPPAAARESAGTGAALLDAHLVSIEEQRDLNATGMTRVQTADGMVVNATPPRYIRLTYWLTAWARDVASEHDLLGRALARLAGVDHVPSALLTPGLQAGGLPVQVSVAAQSSVGGHVADVWASLGEPMKAGLELSLLVPLDVSPDRPQAPPVLERRLRMTGPPPPPLPAIMTPAGIPGVLAAPPSPPPPAAGPTAVTPPGTTPTAVTPPGATPTAVTPPGATATTVTPPGATPASADPPSPGPPVIEEVAYGPEPGTPPRVTTAP